VADDITDGPHIRHLAGIDAGDPVQLEQLTEVLGEADGLVNNVGVAYEGILATQSLESIERTLAINLTSVLYLTKLYVRSRLARRSAGTVISISSIIGVRGYSGLATYSATKAGIDGMTRSLAREMGPKGFRLNSVLPGYFESAMSEGLDETQLGQIIRCTPLGRLATPDDIAPAVRFLLSARCIVSHRTINSH